MCKVRHRCAHHLQDRCGTDSSDICSASLNGFTLTETLIATGILLAGVLVVVTLFASSIQINIQSRQTTQAALLLYDKMERFKSQGPPTVDGLEYVSITDTGEITTSEVSGSSQYVRRWYVSGATPTTVTIVVSAIRGGLGHRPIELIRATAVLPAMAE